MKNTPLLVNVLSLAAICGGALVLTPASGNASIPPGGGSGSCCNQPDSTCYLNLGDGIVIIQSNAHVC
jgi:hypothetical protein